MKNRSKFSALRPHYERGRKELVVGGEWRKQSQRDAVCSLAEPGSSVRKRGGEGQGRRKKENGKEMQNNYGVR